MLVIFLISFSSSDANYEIEVNPLICVTEDKIDLENSCNGIFDTKEKIICQMVLNDLNIIKYQKQDKYFFIDIIQGKI